MEGHYILSRNPLLLHTTVKYFIKGRLKLDNNVRFRTYHHNTNQSIITAKGFKYRKVFYISIPVGTGFYGYNYWRTKRENQRATNFEVKCYCALPLRALSRWWGWFADIELPYMLRPYLYGIYASTFGVNLMEAKVTDLGAYSTLSDFFCRELKENVRKIDHNSSLVSPCDGIILNCGSAENGVVEQVKGVNYNLNKFLGETGNTSEENATPDKHLLKNKNNRLYQITIYLAPGDYHRFHSPTDWQPVQRKHFSGELLSVNPGIASWIPDLFILNERAVYTGYWENGFFSMTAVGATNVGKIKVYFDDGLTTNCGKRKEEKIHHEFNQPVKLKKGDLFGEFRMGSTIVLIFEAPPNFEFNVRVGCRIQMGESIEKFYTNVVDNTQHLQDSNKLAEIRTR